MQTDILNPNLQKDIKKAGEILRNDGLVIIPTETVYGLAANALSKDAVKKIYVAKGRPSDNPLIVHVAEFEDIYPLVKEIPEKADKLAKHFWPAPLTIILPKAEIIPTETSGGLSSVAIRMPENDTALNIIKSAGCPLAAPSANLSGKPSPTSFEHVYEDMNTRVDAIVKGEDCTVGVESTVISFCTEIPTILRPGVISREDIENVIGKVKIDRAVREHVSDKTNVASPGMKYKHYAPKAKIIMSRLCFNDYIKLFEKKPNAKALCFEGEEKELNVEAVTFGNKYDSVSQATELFKALYKIDELGFKEVYARAPRQSGVGLAVYNRLIRACGFQTIEPKIKIIGMTGSSGSGKSTVANALRENGIAVIDCDEISRDPKTYEGECLEKLCEAFGKDICESGILNRKKLAKKAFSSKENTLKLNKITLPVIIERVNQKIKESIDNGHTSIVLDAPTLFEAGADRLCTGIIAVTASEDLRLNRIIERDKISHEEALLRIKAQDKDYTKMADYIVDTQTGNFNIQKIIKYINHAN